MSTTLIVARDPGAASSLVPVARAGASVVIGLDDARPVFERAGIDMVGPETDENPDVAGGWVSALAPRVVLTGTSRLDLVTRDARWWEAARTLGVPSVALLDHWIGYWQKFTVSERFDTTPDVIAVMDAYAREQLIANGARGAHIIVTGHPAFDALVHPDFSSRADTRKRWGVDAEKIVVLFASEPIAADVGNERGYDEVAALSILLYALADRNVHLVVKPHPRETAYRLEQLVLDHGRAANVETQLSGRDAVAGADIVVGMTSVLLLEAAVAGRAVLSIQPGVREPWTDHFATLISTVLSVDEARAWLARHTHDMPLPAERGKAIRMVGFDGHATENVCRLLQSLSS